MPIRKTIANLSTLLTADAVQFTAEFNKAEQVVARYSKRLQKEIGQGAKIGFGIVGAQSAFALVGKEISHVINDIANIPGIPANVVETVNSAKASFQEFRNIADRAIAGVIGFAAQAAQAVGATMAVIAGADSADIQTGLAKQDSPDDQARLSDKNFDQHVSDAAAKLREAQRALEDSGKTRVETINRLFAEAERYDTYAQSSSITTIQKIDAQTESVKKQTEAKQKLYDMGMELNAAWAKESAQMDDISRIGKTATASLAELTQRHAELVQQIEQLQYKRILGDYTPETLELLIQRTKELAAVDRDRIPLLKASAKLADDIGAAFGDSLEEAVFSGKKLSEVMHGLLLDIAKLVFRQTISGPVAGLVSTGLKSLFGAFADGGDPPVGVPSLVGERGPELFVPKSAGTIIPNHALRSRSGAGGGGNNYYIDARGADQGAVERLQAALISLAGPGVVERRAMAASYDSRRRGGF